MKRFSSDVEGRNSLFGRYGGWFLAVLLILFCISARRGPFQAHKTGPNPPVRTSYIEDPDAQIGAALVLVLLTWWLARLSARAGAGPAPIAVSTTNFPVAIAGDFDRTLHIRPPPPF